MMNEPSWCEDEDDDVLMLSLLSQLPLCVDAQKARAGRRCVNRF
jgi:hypothetical protein